MEANKIAVEQARKESFSYRQDSVNLTAREWCVEEKADADVLLGRSNLFAKHLRQEHQVVVVDPNEVIVLDVLEHRLGELTVHFLVRSPGRLVEGDFAGMIVKEWPEDRVYLKL
jgi:hypothetical protein